MGTRMGLICSQSKDWALVMDSFDGVNIIRNTELGFRV